MASVTQRIKEIKQPKGGYISPKLFEKIFLKTDDKLATSENISQSTIGSVVHYLTRFCLNKDKFNAFIISIIGAQLAEKYYNIKKAIKNASKLLEDIKGLDDQSIINACKLVEYDGWYKNPVRMMKYCKKESKIPNEQTISNIKILIYRSLKFFEEYGPIFLEGIRFGAVGGRDSGYTDTVNEGEIDFITKDTLWDFKVSKKDLNSNQTLQLVMYWIMAKHSKQPIFNDIFKIGIFNPRLNVVYLFNMNNLSQNIIKKIETKVICYKE